MIRLAVRCRPEQAEQVLAELVELVPGGVEEERGERLRRVRDLRAARRAAGAARPRGRRRRRARRDRDDRDPRRLGGPLARLPRAGRRRRRADGRPAVLGGGRHGATEIDIVVDPGRAFGTGGARDDARAASSCCSSLADRGLATGAARGLGNRVRRARDRRREARLGPGRGLRPRARRGRGRRRQRRRQRRRGRVERINLREAVPPPAATVTANLTAPLLIPLAERIGRRRDRGAGARWS